MGGGIVNIAILGDFSEKNPSKQEDTQYHNTRAKWLLLTKFPYECSEQGVEFLLKISHKKNASQPSGSTGVHSW